MITNILPTLLAMACASQSVVMAAVMVPEVVNGDFSSAIVDTNAGTSTAGNWYGNVTSGNMAVVGGQLQMKTGNFGQNRYIAQIIQDDNVSSGTFKLQFDLGAVEGASTTDTVLFGYDIYGSNAASAPFAATQDAGYNLSLAAPSSSTLLASGSASFSATSGVSTQTSDSFAVAAGAEWKYYIVRFGVAAPSSTTGFAYNQSQSDNYVLLDNISIVPEPSSALLLLASAYGLVAVSRRHRA